MLCGVGCCCFFGRLTRHIVYSYIRTPYPLYPSTPLLLVTNLQDKEGLTALMWAIINGFYQSEGVDHGACVRELIRNAGADVNLVGSHGGRSGYTALRFAKERSGTPSSLIALLEKAGKQQPLFSRATTEAEVNMIGSWCVCCRPRCVCYVLCAVVRILPAYL